MKNCTVCYSVAELVKVDIEKAFSFFKNPDVLGHWSLGCFDTTLDSSTGICVGHSLFSGNKTEVRIEPSQSCDRITFLLEDNGIWIPRIIVQLHSGADFGWDKGSSIITMIAWRTGGMSDSAWDRLKSCHDVEILLIKNQLER